MISVLTITYKRHHLLEEAIESFLRQEKVAGAEMVIINDNPEVDYVYNHPSVIIFNCKERFPSIASKLEWGYKQCKNNFIYRLDDDDLLAPNALYNVAVTIINTRLPHDIYRSADHYFFTENKYQKKSESINNGNVYTKKYLDRIKWPDRSGDEDVYITFKQNAIICNDIPTSMIYRWGMNTLHISGMGLQDNKTILDQADKVLDNTKGVIELHPHFKEEYYNQLPKIEKPS
jgi:glycosyltransferase involved in cell wall biosynthesis